MTVDIFNQVAEQDLPRLGHEITLKALKEFAQIKLNPDLGKPMMMGDHRIRKILFNNKQHFILYRVEDSSIQIIMVQERKQKKNELYHIVKQHI